MSPSSILLIALPTLSFLISAVADTPAVKLNLEPEVNSVHARQAWIKLDKDLKSAVAKIVRRALPTVMKEVYKKEVSAPCMGALMGFLKALKESKLWAFKMMDSSGRFPEGFLQGTLTSLGNYEECVKINVNETKIKLQGQYCILNLLPPLPTWKPFSSAHLTMSELVNISAPDSVITYLMNFVHNLHVTTIKIGICTPSKCTLEDVDKLVDIIPEQIGLNWGFEVSHCESRKGVEFTFAQTVVLYIIGVVAFLVVVGTIVDNLCTSEDMEKSTTKFTIFQVVKSFSFPSNARKLANYTCPESELSFMYGIIVFTLFWNAMANTFLFINYDVASNFVEALVLLKHVFYEMALNRVFPLQTLFYFSGFVTTYRCLKSTEKGLNVFKSLLSKYCRYTPTYALILALVILTPTWGSGPSWQSHMDPMYRNCRDNWWYNILYINNFIDTESMCLKHTWIFGIAAQLHIISVLILLPLKLYPKIGLIINFVLAVASLASVALTNVYYDLPPNEMSSMLHENDRSYYAEHSYYRVYTHVGVYCAGVFTGYLMAKHPDIKISRKMSLFLWAVTGTGLLASLGTVHEWRLGNMPTPLVSAIYATFSKVALAAFLSWVSVACMTGHSGGAKDVLGWRPFAFFTRLTFVAYIMHVPIINMVMNSKKLQVYVTELEIFYIVVSHIIGTYIISYVLYLFFEAPWLSLVDVLSKRCKGRTFNSELPPQGPLTEKPFKYSEKVESASRNCVNSLEKGFKF